MLEAKDINPKKEQTAQFLMHPPSSGVYKPETVFARASEFLILSACWQSEVRLMTWSQIDLPAHLWTIPAHRIGASWITESVGLDRASMSSQALSQSKQLN